VNDSRRVTLGDLKRTVSLLEAEGLEDKVTIRLDEEFFRALQEIIEDLEQGEE
jgi:hypothetical protein